MQVVLRGASTRGSKASHARIDKPTTDPTTTVVTCSTPLLCEILEIVNNLKFFLLKEETTEQCRVPFGPIL
jgi:hypothetical protein